MADLQLNSRLLVPTILLPFQEIVEEALLERIGIVGIINRPMLEPVDFQPFLFRRGMRESAEITAGMEGLAAPIRAADERHLGLVPFGRTPLEPVVGQRMLPHGIEEPKAIVRKLFLG